MPVISDRLFGGRREIHVVSDQQPGDGFETVEPNLEDVYFFTLKGDKEVAQAA